MNIIKEEDCCLYNKQYKKITYDNGEQILKRYDEYAKMWVQLCFKKLCESSINDDMLKIADNIKHAFY